MAVDASLDGFRQFIGARSTSDDALLTWALEAATAAVKAEQLYDGPLESFQRPVRRIPASQPLVQAT